MSLWARDKGTLKDGTRKFEVINGYWDGRIKDGQVHVDDRPGHPQPGEIVWEGTAPFRSADYNEAIAWIEQQLAGTA